MKAVTSIAARKWPQRHSSWWSAPITSALETSKENRAPARAPQRISLATISEDPLGPPIGSSAPWRASLASVVSAPSGPMPQPTGIGSPRSAAMRIFSLTPVSAVSTTIGGEVRVGKAQAIGSLLTIGSRPPQITVCGGPSVVAWPIIPVSSACIA